MGFYMFEWRKGQIKEATIIGVSADARSASSSARTSPSRRSGHYFVLTPHQITLAMGIYAFVAVGHAGVDAADAARLSQHLHEDRHDPVPRARRHHRATRRSQAPAFSQFVGGGGPIIPGPLFPFVFITIACGAISGLPRAHRVGHDVEDGGQGNATSAPVGYMGDAVRRARRRHGAHRRLGAPPRRLLRDQRRAGGVRDARHPDGQPARICRRRSAKTSSAAPAAPSRSRSAWRRSSASIPGMRGADGLLVSLRDHVRGALHPDDDRLGHARRPLPAAGIDRPRLAEVRRHRTGCRAR